MCLFDCRWRISSDQQYDASRLDEIWCWNRIKKTLKYSTCEGNLREFPITVLLIDDNHAIARLMGHLFALTEFASVTFLHADTVEDGLETLASEPVDLVFLDNRVPPHQRFEDPLREINACSSAKVILLTGTDLEDLGYDALPASLDGFLSKNDMSPASLTGILKQVCFAIR
ncbi:response regulator [Ponticaulis koreensis]|uniref:response regulator n=1 Tax=Ponticaulis koreensis TaxID=1123045 RepID=UPI0003B563DE|nr:response regulator [Ponticaulis koreensis]